MFYCICVFLGEEGYVSLCTVYSLQFLTLHLYSSGLLMFLFFSDLYDDNTEDECESSSVL